MDIGKILGDVLQVAGKVTGIGLLGQAGDALVGKDIPPEQAAAIQDALMKHEEVQDALDVERLRIVVSESLASMQSGDKFTSRARPLGVYAATGITTIISLVVGWCMIVHVPIDMGAIGAMISLLTPLWGNAVWYTTNRTKEKMATTDANSK